MSEQPEAWYEPLTLQGQSGSSNQPIAVSELPKMTRSRQVIKRPQYLKDFQTECYQARNRELRLTMKKIACLRFCSIFAPYHAKFCSPLSYSQPLLNSNMAIS